MRENNHLSNDVLSLLVAGGDLPNKQNIAPMNEQFVDEDLLKQIGALVAEGSSVDKIAKVLDAPADKISATLRRERRRIAIILMSGVAKNLAVYANKYYGIIDVVLKEIERRLSDPEILAETSTTTLIKLLKVSHDWIKPMNENLVLNPPEDRLPDGVVPGGLNVNQNTFNLLVSEAEKVKNVSEKAERSISSRRKTKRKIEPKATAPYDYDIEVEDPSDLPP
jgi:hypothetical protein